MSDVDASPLPEAALWYATHNFPVFPCKPRDKAPLVTGGFHAATNDLTQVRAWWRRWPDANIGIPTGERSGLLAVDIDPRNGGSETIESWITKYGRWPDTAESITGSGGRHIFFKHVPGLRCGPIGAGVDLKTEGGYVVVGPSVHRSGGRYMWDGVEGAAALGRLADAPPWLLQIARGRRKESPATAGPAQRIPKGRRNQELASIAGMLRSRGADYSTLLDSLKLVNERLCDPPLAADEVQRIAESISRYEPSERNERPDAQRIFETLDAGRYILRAPGIMAELEVDRLRREHGELVGELTARCWLPGARGVDGVLSIADFNLSGARARTERAKLLSARAGTKDDVDWVGLLEELCQRVILFEREGGAAIDLCDVEPEDAEECWVVGGLPLLKHHPVILFGDGGSGKSLVALHLAAELARRGERVLYADWELGAGDHARRLRELGGPRGILYARCDRPLVAEADRLRRLVRAHECSYLVIDSAGLATDGPPEAAECANRFFQALRTIGTGSLTIAHISKAEGADKRPFGSVFWHNSARATWFAQRTEAVGDESSFEVGLFNRKANLGPLHGPVGFRITFGRGRTTVERTDVASQPELAGRMSLPQRIAAALRRGAMSTDELAEHLDVEANVLRATISRKKGVFLRLPDGRIALASEGSEGAVQ